MTRTGFRGNKGVDTLEKNEELKKQDLFTKYRRGNKLPGLSYFILMT